MIMGTSVEGILAYGYDLSGVESKWHLKGLDDYDPWRPSWASPEQLEAIDVTDEFDYEAAIAARLQAHDLEGVGVKTYGVYTSEDALGLMLVTWYTKASGASVTSPYLPDLLARRDIERWDDQLAKALEILDVRPWQPHPLWLLTQSCG